MIRSARHEREEHQAAEARAYPQSMEQHLNKDVRGAIGVTARHMDQASREVAI